MENSKLLNPCDSPSEPLQYYILESTNILSNVTSDNNSEILSEQQFSRLLEKRIGIKHLKIIKNEEINKLIDSDKHLDDLITFKDGLTKWRSGKENIEDVDRETRSMNSDIGRWIEKQENVPPPFNFHRSNTGCDLDTILDNSSTGSLIKTYFSQHEILREEHQQMLADIIVEHFYKNEIHMHPSYMLQFAEDIKKRFPTESVLTYYTSAGFGKKNPGGKLYYRYHNIKKKLNKIGLISPPLSKTSSRASARTSKFCSKLVTQAVFINADLLEINDDESIDLCGKKERLQHYEVLPWDDVTSLWKETRILRRNEILTSNCRISAEVFKNWPLYKHSQGPKFVDIDFCHFFPNVGDACFISKWKEDFDNLKTVIGDKLKDAYCISLFEKLDHASNESSKDCILFLSLHGIIKPTARIPYPSRAHKRAQWKPSISDSKRSCVLHVVTINDIQKEISTLRKLYLDLNLTLQPLIIVVGSEETNLKEFYLYIDEVFFKFETFLTCLDSTFKYFQILYLCYPQESAAVWLFLQSYFYNIELPSDVRSYTVVDVMKNLHKLKEIQAKSNNIK